MKSHTLRLGLTLIAIFAVNAASSSVQAQKEIPPPQGKGHAVVVASGKSGMDHYERVARAIAQLGYDVLLVDGNSLAGNNGQALKAAILQAQQLPHALPGKVALVGFSLGGGIALAYGSKWADLVALDIVWYPVTSELTTTIPGFVNLIKVPVLMFAGESDTFENCCLIGTARSIASKATEMGKPLELVTYARTNHDFVEGGQNYNAKSYQDALERTGAKLKEIFGN